MQLAKPLVPVRRLHGKKYRCFIDTEPKIPFNQGMRCDSCNGVITKSDRACYMCGEPVPDYVRYASQRHNVSVLSNIIFTASLALSLFSFFSDRKLPLAISLAISASLLLVRFVADRAVREKSDAARP